MFGNRHYVKYRNPMTTENMIDFPPLPESAVQYDTDLEAHEEQIGYAFTAQQMRDYVEADRTQRQDAETWSLYIAGMVEAYLQSQPSADKREAAIAGIIGRRLWALSRGYDRSQRQAGQEPEAWRISYIGADGIEYRRIFGHNAIGDYRRIDPKATSTPLYTAPQPAAQSARADFEAWFRENHHSRLDRKCANQTYNCPAAFAAWNTWEACAKVYAKPQPAAQPAVEPLTSKQLAECLISIDDPLFMQDPAAALTQFARAIEAAHGVHPTPATQEATQ
jgi:hypothetical protein